MTICAIAKHNANDTRRRTVKQQGTRFVYMRKLSNSYWLVSLHTHSMRNCDAKLDLEKCLKSKNTPYSRRQNMPQPRIGTSHGGLRNFGCDQPRIAPPPPFPSWNFSWRAFCGGLVHEHYHCILQGYRLVGPAVLSTEVRT